MQVVPTPALPRTSPIVDSVFVLFVRARATFCRGTMSPTILRIGPCGLPSMSPATSRGGVTLPTASTAHRCQREYCVSMQRSDRQEAALGLTVVYCIVSCFCSVMLRVSLPAHRPNQLRVPRRGLCCQRERHASTDQPQGLHISLVDSSALAGANRHATLRSAFLSLAGGGRETSGRATFVTPCSSAAQSRVGQVKTET